LASQFRSEDRKQTMLTASDGLIRDGERMIKQHESDSVKPDHR